MVLGAANSDAGQVKVARAAEPAQGTSRIALRPKLGLLLLPVMWVVDEPSRKGLRLRDYDKFRSPAFTNARRS
jgi:excinuclease UvrABC ATPase subunit